MSVGKTRGRVIGALFVVAVLGVATTRYGGFGHWHRPHPVHQPINFSHKRHIEADMDCVVCHEHAEEAAHASLPMIDKCLECHTDANGTNPEEPKVREYAKKGEQIPWIQVNRLPGHVYFSHQAHVVKGKIECKSCHGEMKERSDAVSVPNVHLDMDQCMSCHKSRGASNDCLACHK